VPKKVEALRDRRKRGAGVAAEAARNKEQCGFDFSCGAFVKTVWLEPVSDTEVPLPGAMLDENCLFSNQHSAAESRRLDIGFGT
jgi:hypothetical protein